MNKKEFRKDIAGLRALAVLLVIIFHMGAFVKLDPELNTSYFFELLNQYVTAGFLGVDVFFVISGFLMTSIIFNKVLADNQRPVHAVWSFWKARAKRIVPALLVATVFFFIIVVQLFEPQRLTQFVKEVREALIFTSNFRFARAEGYFAQSALEKVWLHTWSLSVEWQFYILYPLLLLVSKKYLGINKTKLAVVSLTIVSIAVSLILPMTSKSYFMLHIRAWELLAGGIVYLYPYSFKNSLRLPLQIIGLVLIIVSVVVNKEQPIWSLTVPSLAVAGTALVLWVNNKNILLDNKVAQYLGDISYSLYIYHWPVLVILSLMGLLNPIAAVVIIFALAVLSYHLIEKRRDYSYKTLGIYTLCLALFIQVGSSKGWEWRFDTKDYNFNTHQLHALDSAFDYFPEEHHHYSPENPKFILAGDSHAKHFTYVIKKALDSQISYSIFSGAMKFNDLLVVIDPKHNADVQTMNNNFDFRAKLMDDLESPKVMLISQYWSLYENIFYAKKENGEYDKSICLFKGRDCNEIRDDISFRDLLYKELSIFVKQHKEIKFIILGDLFTMGNKRGFLEYTLLDTPLSKMYKEYNDKENNRSNSLLSAKFQKIDTSQIDAINIVLNRIGEENDNVTFIDISKKICKNSVCQTQTDDNMPIFLDKDHITNAGASIFIKDIIDIINLNGIK